MAVIGSVTLDSSISKYEYKDSTLFSTLTAEQINSGAAQVTYWVVRATAQQMWGMSADKNPTVATVKPQLDKLALMEPTDVKADWSDKDEYRVKVTWGYKANDDSHRYVWDNRVGMMMEVKSLKPDKTTADSTLTVITAEQIQAGEMEVPVSRACVTYQITMLLDGSKSPLGKDTVSYAATLPEDKFYHENMGHIDTESLEAQEQPSSVLLTWSNVDDNAVDYYEVWRRDAGSTEDFKCIAEQLNYMQYEDKDVSPVKQYEYYVKEQEVEEYNTSYADSHGNIIVDGTFASAGGQIINTPVIAVSLPSTGGPGTKLFYGIGIAFITMAGILFFIKKKRIRSIADLSERRW